MAVRGSYVVAVPGLSLLNSVDEISPKIRAAARMAINKTIDHARAASVRVMREQVAFSARYLTDSDSSGKPRLGVTSRASDTRLQAVITGRDRPTGLARFVVGSTNPKTIRKNGYVNVQVKPGSTKRLPRAFIFKLRNNNTGLAIRTSGGPPSGAYKPLPIGKNLYLLYGPSVDQIFGGARGVAEQIAPDEADYLEREFNRLLKLDL